MANSKTVSLRIPSELLSKVDQLAEEKYISHKGVPNRSLVILDAITHYFETVPYTENTKQVTVRDTEITGKFQSLETVVQSLSDELTLLKIQLNTLQDSVLNIQVDSSVSDNASDRRQEPQQLSIETEANQQISIPPISRKILVKRLKGFDKYQETTALSKFSQQRKALGDESFADWSQRQDIDGVRWREETTPKSKAKQYLPDDALSDEVQARLLNWIQENS